MGSTRHIDYLVQNAQYVVYPIHCTACDAEIEYEHSMLLGRDDKGQPLCDEHDDQAAELVTIERHIGYPNNNLHPETGEPGWLNSDGNGYTWFEVVDRRTV